MKHIGEFEETLNILLDGVELALLVGVLEMVNTWPFRMAAPQAKLVPEERKLARKIAAYLYEERKGLLIAAGVFMPPVTPVPPPSYVEKQAAIQAVVTLTQEEIHACLSMLRFCHEELVVNPEDPEGPEDPTDWDCFCSIAPGSVGYFHPAREDLLHLADKLEGLLRQVPAQRAQREMPPGSTHDWPPARSIGVSMNGVEWELLKGSLSFLNVWTFAHSTALAMLVPSEQEMARVVGAYLLGEQQSILSAAGALVPPARPVPPEFVAMRAAFELRHFLMREHLQVCLAALRTCYEEFKEDWVYFCQTATNALYRFDSTPSDLLSLADKLERLLNEAPDDE